MINTYKRYLQNHILGFHFEVYLQRLKQAHHMHIAYLYSYKIPIFFLNQIFSHLFIITNSSQIYFSSFFFFNWLKFDSDLLCDNQIFLRKFFPPVYLQFESYYYYYSSKSTFESLGCYFIELFFVLKIFSFVFQII